MSQPIQTRANTLRANWQSMFRQVFQYIKENKKVPWRQNWKTPTPVNYYSNRPYNGFNVAMIYMFGNGEYAWATRNQIESHGHSIITDDKAVNSNPSIMVGFVDFPDKDQRDEDRRERYENPDKPTIGTMRVAYEVFPMIRIMNPMTGQPLSSETVPPKREALKVNKFYTACKLKFQKGVKPLYNLLTDTISMPPSENFDSIHAYEATKLHETGHAIDHPKRAGNVEKTTRLLARDTGQYGREELTAEFFAMLSRTMFGIDEPRLLSNELAYIDGWYKSLEKDPEMLLWACGDAQRRLDWGLQQLAS